MNGSQALCGNRLQRILPILFPKQNAGYDLPMAKEITESADDDQWAFFERLDKLSPLTPLTEKFAAWVLGLSLSTLQHWRSDPNNPGPPFVKYQEGKSGGTGKRASIRYILGDLLKYRQQMTVGDVDEADEIAKMRRDRHLAKMSHAVMAFTDWVQVGNPADNWLVVRTATGIRDVFSCLDDESIDPDDAFTIPLQDYLLERLGSPAFVEASKRTAYTELAEHLDSTSHPDCRAAYVLSQSMGLGEVETIANAIRGTAK